MQKLTLLLITLAFGFITAQELSVVTTSKPENCDTEGTKKSQPGDSLSMHYTGTIDESSPTGEKGKQFDSSIGRGPFTFKLGAGEVIEVDEGLKAMCVGEKRTLVIPRAWVMETKELVKIFLVAPL